MVYDISYNLNLVDIEVLAAFTYLLLPDILKMVISTIGSTPLFLGLETYTKVFNKSNDSLPMQFFKGFSDNQK